MNTTTITLNKAVKRRLDKLKKHARESYNEVVVRLLGRAPREDSADDESVRESIAILSEPETMASLARSLKDLKRGRVYAIDEV